MISPGVGVVGPAPSEVDQILILRHSAETSPAVENFGLCGILRLQGASRHGEGTKSDTTDSYFIIKIKKFKLSG